MNKAFLIFGGVLAYSLFMKGKALGNLNFYPGAAKGISFDGTTPMMQVGLITQNTSGQKIVLHSVAGNVYANQYLIGNVGYFLPQTINPNSQGVLWLTIRFGLVGVIQDIITAIQSGTFNQDLEFQGYANVDNYQVPLKLTYKLGI
jgi:hypothetical protein